MGHNDLAKVEIIIEALMTILTMKPEYEIHTNERVPFN